MNLPALLRSWWQAWVLAAVAVLVLVLNSWALVPAEFFRVHDYTHVTRVVEMRQSLLAGEVPPLWAKDLGYGYGMPLFLFYGPLPTLIAVTTTFLGLSELAAVRALLVMSNVLAFAGSIRLLRRWGLSAALVGATFFSLAPYRMVDLYVRGAFNELFALSLLPWILDSVLRITPTSWKSWMPSSLWMAALVLSHNLTALIALPLIGAAALVWQAQARQFGRRIVQLTAAALGAIALSAFYAVPAALENKNTIIGSILSGYFDFRLHFLYIRQLWWARWGYGGSAYGPDDGITFHLGIIAWISLVLLLFWCTTIVVRFIRHRRLPPGTRARLIWTITVLFLGGASLFMTLERSRFLWELVPVLQYLQFPWRFLAPATLWISLWIALATTRVRLLPLRWWLCGIAVIIIAVTMGPHFRPERFIAADDHIYSTDIRFVRETMSDILPDYLPATFDRSLPPVAPEERIQVDGAATTWDRNAPGTLRLLVGEGTPARVTWNIADFAGWQYFVNDGRVYPVLLPDGRRQLEIVGPVSSVGARLDTTPLRAATQLVSLAAALFILGSLVPWQRKDA